MPMREDRIEEFAPSGAVAGIFARTDTQRGRLTLALEGGR